MWSKTEYELVTFYEVSFLYKNRRQTHTFSSSANRNEWYQKNKDTKRTDFRFWQKEFKVPVDIVVSDTDENQMNIFEFIGGK